MNILNGKKANLTITEIVRFIFYQRKMLRASLIDGANRTYDRDMSKLLEAVSDPGVISGLNIVAGKIQPGKGFVLVTRANTDSFYCYVENTAEITVDVTGTKKIWLEVLQSSIDDGLGNNQDGSGMVEVKTGSAYPTKNFMKIASVTASVVTDERVFMDNIQVLKESLQDQIDTHETRIDAIDSEIADINTQLQPPSALSNSDLLLGEAITSDDVLNNRVSLFVENMITYAEATLVANIGDVVANTRFEIPIIGTGLPMTELKLGLKKFVSPSVDLKLRFETNNAGSPSGTIYPGTTETTIATSGLTTSVAEKTITLAQSITIPLGTIVWVVVYPGTYGSETINATNYFGIAYLNKNTDCRNIKVWNGTTHSNLVGASTSDSANMGTYQGASTTNGTDTVVVTPKKDAIMLLTMPSGWTMNGGGYTNITSTTPNIMLYRGVQYTFTKTYGYTNYYSGGSPYSGTNVDITRSATHWEAFTITTSDRSPLFPYIVGTGISSQLLSKTDARYIHRLPDIPRLCTKAYAIGEKPIYEIGGYSKVLSSLTIGSYFVGDTPGLFSPTAGKNYCKLGEAKSSKLFKFGGMGKLSLTVNTVYYAPADGFVHVRGGGTLNYSASLYADNNSNPTTVVATASNGNVTGGTDTYNLTYPILRGQYFKVTGNMIDATFIQY